MHQGGGMNQANALRFRLGKKLGKRAERLRMRMPDCDSFMFFVRVLERKFQLAANRSNILNIV